MSRKLRLPVFALVSWLLSACAHQPLTGSEIDDVVSQAMAAFDVPGAAVGVVKDGEIIHAAGYGVRELGRADPVDTRTLFRIASTTKAMTAASLAMLVDSGMLGWDDRVIDHMPMFQLHDPWVTEHFTVTDLLTHRSGLPPYAGDLMLWPKPNSYTRADIIYGLRFFRQTRNFRTGYDYDNLLYIVAGELVPAVTGQAWEDFVDANILARLGTERCFAGEIPDSQMYNLAAPHAEVEDTLSVIERNRIRSHTAIAAAAGGVRCSLGDMLKWVQLQLSRGLLPDGSALFSKTQSDFMWRPQTIRDVPRAMFERDRTHFRAYALGWRLADVHGYRQVHHTGSFTGFNSFVVLIPELNLGVIVMLNASAEGARQSITRSIVRPYLGQHDVDWVQYHADRNSSNGEATTAATDMQYEQGSVDSALSEYEGVYSDPWFGDVSITLVEDQLWFAAAKSPKLTGRMWPQQRDTFMVRWEDRSAERDIFVDFVGDESGRFARMQVRCLAEEIKCAFLDQEMNFVRTTAE